MLVYQRAALQSWRKCSVNGFCLQVLNYFPRHAVLLMSAERNSQAHRSCCPLTSPLHREKANISFPFPTRPPCVCQPPLCSLSAFLKKKCHTPPQTIRKRGKNSGIPFSRPHTTKRKPRARSAKCGARHKVAMLFCQVTLRTKRLEPSCQIHKGFLCS